MGRTKVYGYDDLGGPGRDIRLFTHSGVRCRLYRPDTASASPTTVALAIAEESDRRDYLFTMDGGDDPAVAMRRFVFLPDERRRAWRELSEVECLALVRLVHADVSAHGDGGVSVAHEGAPGASLDPLSDVLRCVTRLSPGECEVLFAPAQAGTDSPTMGVDGTRRPKAGLTVAALLVLVLALVAGAGRAPALDAITVVDVARSIAGRAPDRALRGTAETSAGANRSAAARKQHAAMPVSPSRQTKSATPPRPGATSTRSARPTTWVAAFPGAHWACTNGATINVVIDPTGAQPQAVAAYVGAIEAASGATGRTVQVNQVAFPAHLAPTSGTIYVAWHAIDGVPAPNGLHPAWTRLDLTMPPLADGSSTPEIVAAETVFSPGLPGVTYFHETGREFDLGDSPYPGDAGFGGNFASARVPASQTFSPGDIAGLQAGAPAC